jgi:hypothetical protein
MGRLDRHALSGPLTAQMSTATAFECALLRARGTAVFYCGCRRRQMPMLRVYIETQC